MKKVAAAIKQGQAKSNMTTCVLIGENQGPGFSEKRRLDSA
jgi:hypothetical protein